MPSRKRLLRPSGVAARPRLLSRHHALTPPRPSLVLDGTISVRPHWAPRHLEYGLPTVASPPHERPRRVCAGASWAVAPTSPLFEGSHRPLQAGAAHSQPGGAIAPRAREALPCASSACQHRPISLAVRPCFTLWQACHRPRYGTRPGWYQEVYPAEASDRCATRACGWHDATNSATFSQGHPQGRRLGSPIDTPPTAW